MSDAFLPEPPDDEGRQEEDEIRDLEDDAQPDVLTGPDGEDGDGPAERDAGAFRAPQPGDRLTADELEAELD